MVQRTRLLKKFSGPVEFVDFEEEKNLVRIVNVPPDFLKMQSGFVMCFSVVGNSLPPGSDIRFEFADYEIHFASPLVQDSSTCR